MNKSEKLHCLKGLKIEKPLLQRYFFQNLPAKKKKMWLVDNICRPSKNANLNNNQKPDIIRMKI